MVAEIKSKYNTISYINCVANLTTSRLDVTYPAWCRLNKCRTGHGPFWANMFWMGLIASPACECSAALQTAAHITGDCLLHDCPGEESLQILNDPATQWLTNTNCII